METQARESVDAYNESYEAWAICKSQLLTAQRDFELKKAHLTANGLTGKNAEERKANLELAMRSEAETILELEKAVLFAEVEKEQEYRNMKFDMLVLQLYPAE